MQVVLNILLILTLAIIAYYACGLIPAVAIERAIEARRRQAAKLGIRNKVAHVVKVFGHPDPKGSRVFREGPLRCTISDFATVDKTYEVQWKGEVVFTAVPGRHHRSEVRMVLRYAPGEWEAQLESHFARATNEAKSRESEEAIREAKQRVKNWGV